MANDFYQAFASRLAQTNETAMYWGYQVGFDDVEFPASAGPPWAALLYNSYTFNRTHLAIDHGAPGGPFAPIFGIPAGQLVAGSHVAATTVLPIHRRQSLMISQNDTDLFLANELMFLAVERPDDIRSQIAGVAILAWFGNDDVTPPYPGYRLIFWFDTLPALPYTLPPIGTSVNIRLSLATSARSGTAGMVYSH